MSKETLNSLAKKRLEAHGYLVECVEQNLRWGRNFKRDLFNCIDVIAIGNGETRAVQVTDHAHVADRIRKVRENEALPKMLGAGWKVEVWAYKARALYRVEEIK